MKTPASLQKYWTSERREEHAEKLLQYNKRKKETVHATSPSTTD